MIYVLVRNRRQAFISHHCRRRHSNKNANYYLLLVLVLCVVSSISEAGTLPLATQRLDADQNSITADTPDLALGTIPEFSLFFQTLAFGYDEDWNYDDDDDHVTSLDDQGHNQLDLDPDSRQQPQRPLLPRYKRNNNNGGMKMGKTCGKRLVNLLRMVCKRCGVSRSPRSESGETLISACCHKQCGYNKLREYCNQPCNRG